jgi:hypothetical protein
MKKMTVNDVKGAADKVIARYSSRKLLVWVVSTVLLAHGDINGDQWVAIALAYVGTQAFVDAAMAWKHGK